MYSQPHDYCVQVAGSELAKVRMLNVFGPSALQIGDRNFYHLKATKYAKKNSYALTDCSI